MRQNRIYTDMKHRSLEAALRPGRNIRRIIRGFIDRTAGTCRIVLAAPAWTARIDKTGFRKLEVERDHGFLFRKPRP